MVWFVKSTVRFVKSMKYEIFHTKTPITMPFLIFDQKEEKNNVKIGYSGEKKVLSLIDSFIQKGFFKKNILVFN